MIVSCLPATDSTTGLLDGGVLAVCKEKSPLFINVGRGNIIKEDEILTALNNGWISYAVLDVFNTEPLPTTSKLWDHSQVCDIIFDIFVAATCGLN